MPDSKPTLDLDRQIGEILVRNGKLTQRRLNEMLDIRNKQNISIEEQIRRENIAGEDELQTMRRKARQESYRLSPLNGFGEAKLFGQKAVQIYRILQEDVDRCIQIQHDTWEKEKRTRHLGEILVEQQVLTPEQVKSLLFKQNKLIVRCEKCGHRYNINKDDKSMVCPDCEGPLFYLEFSDRDISINLEIAEHAARQAQSPAMTSRERFAAAMAHRNGDRTPVDIGATTLTSMTAKCQESLRKFLGFSGPAIPTNSGVDQRILEWAGTDFRSVGGILQLPSPHTRTVSNTEYIDCWGVRRSKLGSYYEITGYPLKNASVADIKSYQWPEPRADEKLLAKWESEAKALKNKNKYVVIAEHPLFGILELGCWMCSYDDFLMKLAGEPDFVRAFMDKALDIQLKIIEQYYPVLGPYIDLTTSGDDFGMQNSPMLSPRAFEKCVVPYFKERIRRTKELGHCYYWHHTCGSVFRIIGQLIGCGVDILNPVQTSATDMEPKKLKERYGNKIVFWGGVDVQQFLPAATTDEVRSTVKDLLNVLGRDGGYVMAPAHNMQDDIPPENIAAWVETIKAI
jgi:uroporphyrinogen decarboxylase